MDEPAKFPKLAVRESAIHGRGVFAAEPIKEGQKIIEYTGEKISSAEGNRRSEMSKNLTYIFILNGQYDIDGSVNGNDARLINHSCDANAYIGIIDGHIWVFADRDIAEGEELTYDYSFDADKLEECNCKSGKCRGFINDPEDKKTHKLLEEKSKS